MDSENKKSEVSFLNANLTSIMSVALVLILLGLVAIFMIVGNNLSNSIRGNVGFTVVMSNSATDHQVNELKRYWNDANFVASVKFTSRDEAMKIWQAETGENLEELLGVNPLNHEFDIRVQPQYSSSDSLNAITARVGKFTGVESVIVQREMVDAINNNLRKISMVLLLVAMALIAISFALINNTIQLSIYSKRFIIHTMKLVGATPGFIRRPFVVASVINGVIAAVVADVVLCLGLYYGSSYMVIDGAPLISSLEVIGVVATVIAAGIILCALSASIATTKYIRLDYDALFKR